MRTRPFHIKMPKVSPSGEIHIIFGLLYLISYSSYTTFFIDTYSWKFELEKNQYL